MKTQNRIIALSLLVLTALLLLAAPVAAQAIATEFTETEACLAAPVNPGVWSFPDGNIHIRGLVWQCTDTASDSRLSGSNTIVMNANWNSAALGPVWGTFHLVNAGGEWEGTWEGTMTAGGLVLHGTGAGKGGYEGLRFWLEGGSGAYRGRILDP